MSDSFAQIRALFRPRDVAEMSFVFDLSSYDDVRERAEDILDRLEDGSMPCDQPWPHEDIRRFRAWIEAGMPP